jgi:hypothetical protein
MRHADVGRIDVTIDVVVADVAVEPFANMICQPADGKQVMSLEKREAVVGRKAFASDYFMRDRFQVRIGDAKFRWHDDHRLAILSGAHHDRSGAPKQ